MTTPALKAWRKADAAAKREKLVAKLEQWLRAEKLPQWEREYTFDPDREWRFDLAWPDLHDTAFGSWAMHGLAVEVHGGVYSNGRHTRGKGFTEDREKMNEAQLAGWTVLEVTEEHIDNGKAIEWIRRALQG